MQCSVWQMIVVIPANRTGNIASDPKRNMEHVGTPKDLPIGQEENASLQRKFWMKMVLAGINLHSFALVTTQKHRPNLKMTLAGLEPAIFGSEDQRLIH